MVGILHLEPLKFVLRSFGLLLLDHGKTLMKLASENYRCDALFLFALIQIHCKQQYFPFMLPGDMKWLVGSSLE